MKFLALAALVAVASGAACTDAEIAEDPPKCTVTTAAVEADADNNVDAADESIDCVLVSEADPACDEDDEEEEASSALFAGVASAAVAATMMF